MFLVNYVQRNGKASWHRTNAGRANVKKKKTLTCYMKPSVEALLNETSCYETWRTMTIPNNRPQSTLSLYGTACGPDI